MFSDPHHIIAQLPLQPGMSVADLGSGIGSFAFTAAQKIGPSGAVYACEVQKDMITRIMNEARDRGINHVHAVHANIEIPQGTKLRDSSIDWVIVANTLFQIEHRETFAREVYRILKTGGSVIIIDWSESFGNIGPHVKDVISSSETIALFESVGFSKTSQMAESGAHHYAVVFKK